MPYIATAFPLEGAVPAGRTVVSPDDPNLSASVLSTWPDGSAAVVVLAGQTAVSANVQRKIGLAAGTSSGAPLTAARVGDLIKSISCNFGAAGTGALSTFSSPEKVWWANARTICARYRIQIGNAGLEAVLDVHAFASDHAFVECVIENGRINASAAAPTAPSNKAYTNATVTVNGTTIATVSSPSAGGNIPRCRRYSEGYSSVKFAGGHEPFRAWYCSTWVGVDPQIEVTHDTASMREHPLFFKPAEESTENLATKYGQTYDTYEPWATCRLRAPAMDGGGDDQEIALYTECQADYLLTGSQFARRAILATGTAALTLNWHWRHTDGTPPTREQVAGKNTTNGNWPSLGTEPRYGPSTNDASHIPAIALVPFLCRPSPMFIEIAQKELAWHHSNFNSTDGGHPYDQVRSRAWRARNYSASIFLTPDADAARKAGYRAALASNIPKNNAFLNASYNTLNVLWGLTPDGGTDADHDSRARTQHAPWMNHFCIMTWHMVDQIKVLRGPDATAWSAMTDKAALYPVRRVNEATGGEWRYHPYTLTIGDRDGTIINMGSGNWGAMTRSDMTGTLPAAAGPWLSGTPADWSGVTTESSGGISYPSIFWSALCCSVERGVSGASDAWAKVVTNGGITNLATWRQGFRQAPRFNRWPRNK